WSPDIQRPVAAMRDLWARIRSTRYIFLPIRGDVNTVKLSLNNLYPIHSGEQCPLTSSQEKPREGFPLAGDRSCGHCKNRSRPYCPYAKLAVFYWVGSLWRLVNSAGDCKRFPQRRV